MRALVFKIRVDHVALQNYGSWKRADRDFIMEQAKRNHIDPRMDMEENQMIFEGDLKSIFLFLYDLAYRYDIELV